MSRWIALLVIGALVVSGLSGSVVVVADDNLAHAINVETASSSRIARAISRDLGGDKKLIDSDISVREDGGVVTLSGEVDAISSLQYAIDAAARYEEVESVVSQLTLKIGL